MRRISNIVLCLVIFILCAFNIQALNLSYSDEQGNTVKVSDFRDTKGHWAHDMIYKWGDFGIIKGYDDATFHPDAPIKRGDFSIIVDNLIGLKTTIYNFYTDLPNGAYYRDALLRCVAAGYISGTGQNSVSPESYTTREQAATILCRIFNIDTSYTGSTGFADDAQISGWAKPSVYVMRKLGYMNGNTSNQCLPQSPVTRAELITMLDNICNTFIPKRDATGQGSSFTGDYPVNLVTSRNIELKNASVGRDLVLTQATSTLSMNNSKVNGRILVLGKNNLTLKNTSVSQIVLMDGKTTITGVDEGVESVYVSSFASESTIDAIPDTLILESGARVSVAGVMYENTSNKTKTYYGYELKEAIAEDQGYVVGGPKVSGVTFSQDEDNTISVSNIKIVVGDSEIKEVGVVWLSQNKEEDILIPTYNSAEGKTLYSSNKYEEPFGFTINKVKGTKAYRVYVKDRDGLYAYSNTYLFTEYSYSISMQLAEDTGNYPSKITANVLLKGENIPDITSVSLIWDITEKYSDTHNQTSMSLSSKSTTNKTYSVMISSPSVERQLTPPTAFGYTISFKNGTVITKFPVLTNAIPAGVSPMSVIQTGTASYVGGSTLTIKDNQIKTNYIIPSEIGVIYLTSTQESVSSPSESTAGWVRKAVAANIKEMDVLFYDVEIPMSSNTGYTYYCAYVKTDTGYWYGTVQKIDNNVQGDEDGPRIASNPTVAVLNENTALVTFQVTNLTTSINTVDKLIVFGSCNGVSDTTLLNKSLSNFDYEILSGGNVSILFTDLKINSSYNIGLQVKDNNGSKSNVMSISFNTSNPMNVGLNSKILNTYGWVEFTVEIDNEHCYLSESGHTISDSKARIRGSYSGGRSSISVVDVTNYEKTQVSLKLIYSPFGNSKGFEFIRVLDLY